MSYLNVLPAVSPNELLPLLVDYFPQRSILNTLLPMLFENHYCAENLKSRTWEVIRLQGINKVHAFNQSGEEIGMMVVSVVPGEEGSRRTKEPELFIHTFRSYSKQIYKGVGTLLFQHSFSLSYQMKCNGRIALVAADLAP